MTSALVSSDESQGRPALEADLRSVGIDVVTSGRRSNLVQEVLRSAPDLVICYDDRPSEAFFASTLSLQTSAPKPVVVFTNDADADKIERATQSGIHAYVVNGYGLHRLRSVIHLAQARFRHEELIREELADLSSRFEERKLIDRAKGILMRARQVSEEDAFKILRTASMQSNQRMGAVAENVIHAAYYAEAVNRSGQLRMLSQRVVKLYALCLAQIDPAGNNALLADSIARVTHSLAIVSKRLSSATFGDLVARVEATWQDLKQALAPPTTSSKLQSINGLAEALLTHAEQLTSALEVAGFTATLHVINVSGRQRMLSQRIAKQALLGFLLKGKPGEIARGGAVEAIDTFEQALGYLQGIPLSTKAIRGELSRVDADWKSLRAAVADIGTEPGRVMVAKCSETLLESFEQLTTHYERSMQALIG